MKIDWSIMLDELIYVGGAMAMAVMALVLIGIGYLWIGGV